MMHIVAYLVVCHLHHPTQMPQFCGANQEQMAVHNGVDFNLSVDRIYYGLATICTNMCALHDTLPVTPSATLECIISIVHLIKHMQFFFSVISMNMCWCRVIWIIWIISYTIESSVIQMYIYVAILSANWVPLASIRSCPTHVECFWLYYPDDARWFNIVWECTKIFRWLK